MNTDGENGCWVTEAISYPCLSVESVVVILFIGTGAGGRPPSPWSSSSGADIVRGGDHFMSYVRELVCVHCHKSYQPTGRDMTCGDCGSDDGILEIRFDLAAVRAAWQKEPLDRRPLNHWRYRELLPLEPDSIPHRWPVGWTPILDLTRLAGELGLAQLLVKDEGRNPTGSLKDRASSVGVAHALQRGATTIACASTGNAATSLAGHAALTGLPAVIFVPQNAAAPKLAQLLVYGACVFAVAGPYERAYQLCSEACDRVRLVQSQLRDQPGAGRRQEDVWAGNCRTVRGAGRRRAGLGRGECRRWLHDRRHLERPGRNARAGRDRPTAAHAWRAGGRRGAGRSTRWSTTNCPTRATARQSPTASTYRCRAIGGKRAGAILDSKARWLR